MPLLKTLWVCKKAEKTLPNTPENRERPDFLEVRKRGKQTRVVINGKRALKLFPDKATKRVRFEIVAPKNDSEVDKPTMSGATAKCPFCGSKQPGDYIKRCGHEGKLKVQMTTVIYQETYGKEYRAPADADIDAAEVSEETLEAMAHEIPHGIPDEPLPGPKTLGFSVPLYGFKKWSDLFTERQLLVLMTFVKWTREAKAEMEMLGYPAEWGEAVEMYSAILVDRIADYNSTICLWSSRGENMGHTFARFALPVAWDFAEVNPFSQTTGGYSAHIGWVVRFLKHVLAAKLTSTPYVHLQSSRKTALTKG